MTSRPGAPTRIHQNPASWQAGYVAGASGGDGACPPEVPDGLAYASGLVEGRAARERAAVLDAQAPPGEPG